MPSVSFSNASSAARSNSTAEIGGRCWWAPVLTPSPAAGSAKSKIEPWPSCASSWDFWPADWAAGSASSIPAPGRAGRVEGAALDQAFDRAFVDRARVDPLAEVPDRGDRRLLAGAEDRLDRRVADVLDRVEPEPDRVLADDEAVVGRVDVRRQDVDPHLLAAVDEERHLVFGVHHRGDHRRHVLGRVVGLEVGGAVGDQPVAGGVGLVERVVGGGFVQLPEILGDRLPRSRTPPAPA